MIINYAARIGRSRVRGLVARAYRIRRRLHCELFEIDVTKLSALATARDPLELRALWRSQGRPLVRKTGYVNGKAFRYIAP